MKKMMRLFLMSVLCGILPISLLLGSMPVAAYTGNSTKDLTAGADIRVMSYNTLVDNDEANGGWSWGQPLGNRAEKAAAAILHYQPDVIGFQENNYNWHVALRALLPDYDYVNANVPMSMPLEDRNSLGKKDWMCTTMMYNTNTLELLDYELIGYSVNYWGCIQRMRYLSMALFRVKATGKRFVFTSTHFDAENKADGRGQKNRVIQATEMAENIQRYVETYGCSVISTGDFNSGYNDDPISKIREMTGMTSHSNNRGGIDYILYTPDVTAKYFTVVNDADLSGASDHKPIFADLSIPACEHVYNSDYDDDCNVCGEVREVAVPAGDGNGDGKINNKDLGLLQQHLNEWNVAFNVDAMDVTGDGKVNNRDLGLLQQYLNEWNVHLG